MTSELLSWAAVPVALSSVIVSYHLLRLQRDPELAVYATPDHQRPSIINLVLENIGNGIALDVTFKSNRDIPVRAFGFEDAQEPRTMDSGVLINGIASFLPGEERIIPWGQYGGLKKGLGNGLLDITATYYSKRPLRIWTAKHRSVSQIDSYSQKPRRLLKLGTNLPAEQRVAAMLRSLRFSLISISLAFTYG
ncbi:hypothetical protein EKL30_03560 [Candidimonas sp. SYP-B2681]|uniref:hypothetical protein n=1 Tax=Candidimonas sp. SYP-B2681 TaxID=2497686 RepID=UPI000F877E05|nr:hypothetical protein [Candidimonas sp. SYP-B2681]RTZ48052.1 hypothetical protein EKL30_03560 [Candidimonas sp. SYP-B2681]